MALERIGLGGVLTFDSTQAVRGQNQARDAMGRFIRQVNAADPPLARMAQRLRNLGQRAGAMARRVGQGVSQIAGGLRNAGAAALPLTLAMGAGVVAASAFEQQMSNVGSITNGSAEDMARLTAEARTLGIESAFSASEAGEAMEALARAGADTNQVIGATSGVTALAAAESLELAQSADIVAQSTQIMGRSWEQAGNTADILVRASQRANTDVAALGQAMRFGGLAARTAGLDMEETTGILARLADAGLRGSSGGTAMVNALNKLANPTRAGAAELERLGIEMTRTEGGGVDFVNIMQQLGTATEGITDPLERTRIATQIFGVRGSRAFNALAQAGEESVDSLISDLRRASDGEGAAQEAATRRLDNFRGALTLLMSSLEGVAITLFGPLLEPMKNALQTVTTFLNNVLQGVSAVMDAGDDTEARFAAFEQIFGFGDGFANVVLGIVDAIEMMQEAFTFVQETITALTESADSLFGGDTTRAITRWTIILGFVAAAMAPILVGIGAVIFVVSTVLIPIFEGLLTIAGTIGLPLLAVAAILAGAFLLIRREGESVGETLTRIWSIVTVAASRVWNEALLPLWTGITEALGPAIEEMGVIWDEIMGEVRLVINEIADEMFGATDGMSMDWRLLGQAIGTIIGAVGRAILGFVRFAVPIIGFVIRAFFRLGRGISHNVTETLGGVFGAIGNVFRGFQALFSGNILSGLRQIGQGILDLVLEPLKMVVRQIITLADAVGGESLVPDAVREFSRAGEAPSTLRAAGATAREGGLFDALFGDGAVPEAPATAGEPSAARNELDSLGEQVAARRARLSRRRGAPSSVTADIQLQDEREVNVESNLCVDGSEVSVASARHNTEVGERAGFRATPWQRRMRVEQGAAPVTTG